MGIYNGLVSSVSGVPLNGSTTTSVSATIPGKVLIDTVYSVRASALVGATYYVNVIGAVGGATFVIAGITGLNNRASYVLGTSGGGRYLSPRPSVIEWGAGGGNVTANLYVAGRYGGD